MTAFRAGLSLSHANATIVVFGLPGCVVSAATADDARALLPTAIAEYLHWLSAHGESHVADDARAEISEEVDPAETGAADSEFCFEDDVRPVWDSEVERAVKILGCSRADLSSLLDGLPDALLDWRPPLSAMARVDEWKPDVLTIREIVRDIAAAESYYRRALGDGYAPPDPHDELYDAALQHERLVAALRALSGSDRGRVFRRRMPWQDAGEEHWTARKVIRRAISHERFHTAEIRQRLAWIVVGVPDFGPR